MSEKLNPPLYTEEACSEFLFQLKWPNGFLCPFCRHTQAYKITTRRLPLYECRNCGLQSSLTTGTVMQGSRTPLTKWFMAIKLISEPCRGISALALSHMISVTYKTAWSMLHKIRYAMGMQEEHSKLQGTIILNDATYGRPHNPTVHRHIQETPVIIGASMDGVDPSEITISIVPSEHLSDRRILDSAATDFIQNHVAREATIEQVALKRYTPRKLKKTYPLFLQANHWINSTFHGLGRKHLQAYFDEYCSRTNLLLKSSPIFENISRICTQFGTITYTALVGKKAAY